MSGPASGDVALPIILGRWTAQRQEDVLPLLWSAYDGKSITLRQGKTGSDLIIPVEDDLRAILGAAAMTRTAAVICTTAGGTAWKVDHFRHRFAEVRAELGLPDDVHYLGLRHTRLTELAQGRASERELQATDGHKTTQALGRYTKHVQQEQLAKAAVIRLCKHSRNEKASSGLGEVV